MGTDQERTTPEQQKNPNQASQTDPKKPQHGDPAVSNPAKKPDEHEDQQRNQRG